jgi:ABC-type polysaccharide/polyol phosphate transport system ATPase subunit
VRENISGLTEGAPAILAPALTIAVLTVGTNLLIDALKPGDKNERAHIEVTGLTVSVGDVPIVSDISFAAQRGEVLALIGNPGRARARPRWP